MSAAPATPQHTVSDQPQYSLRSCCHCSLPLPVSARNAGLCAVRQENMPRRSFASITRQQALPWQRQGAMQSRQTPARPTQPQESPPANPTHLDRLLELLQLELLHRHRAQRNSVSGGFRCHPRSCEAGFPLLRSPGYCQMNRGKPLARTSPLHPTHASTSEYPTLNRKLQTPCKLLIFQGKGGHTSQALHAAPT